MTYDEIKAELEAMRGKPSQESHNRAQTLLALLIRMGIAPRRVHLNLRALGLSPRQLRRHSVRTSSRQAPR